MSKSKTKSKTVTITVKEHERLLKVANLTELYMASNREMRAYRDELIASLKEALDKSTQDLAISREYIKSII